MRWVFAVSGAFVHVLSLFVLPWARYGDISIPLDRFTGWQVHAVGVTALYACVLWARFAPAAGRRVATAAGAATGLVAAVSAIVLGLRYDNASDFFPGAVPMVMASPGLGPLATLVGVALGLGALFAHDPAATPLLAPRPTA